MKTYTSPALLLVLFATLSDSFTTHQTRHLHILSNPKDSSVNKGFHAVYKPSSGITPFFVEESSSSPTAPGMREKSGEMVKFDAAQLNAIIENQTQLMALKKAEGMNNLRQGQAYSQAPIENNYMNNNNQMGVGPMPMGAMGYGAMNVGGWGYPTVNGFDWFGNYEMVNMKHMHHTPYSSYYPYGSSYYNWYPRYGAHGRGGFHGPWAGGYGMWPGGWGGGYGGYNF